MDHKKILIVCHLFYPENTPRAHRATELAKEFSRQGHEVKVLIPEKSQKHDAFARKNNIVIEDLGKLHWKSPDFGTSTLARFFTRLMSRFLLLAFEYPDIELMLKVRKALRHESGHDLLISVAVPYPIHWGVASVWNRKQAIGKYWIADCGDPYMGNKTDSFKKLFYFKYVEKWFMRKADYVTIPVESARPAYYKEFHHKIRVVPQGFRVHAVRPLKVEKKKEGPTFAYAGGFIPRIRDPRPFLEYLSTLPHDFRFFLFTSKPEWLDGYKERLGEKIQIRSYIPREQLLRYLAAMDFLVNFDNNTDSAIPSKLIDYAIAGRPVLNVEKQLDTSVIKQFLVGDYSHAMTPGNIDPYRIENVCTQFLELVQKQPVPLEYHS